MTDRIAVTVLGTNLVMDYGSHERAVAAMEALEAAPTPTIDRWRDLLDTGNGAGHWTGKPCVEVGCTLPAGTLWSPLWCAPHNAERIARISASLAALDTPTSATHTQPSVRLDPEGVNVPGAAKVLGITEDQVRLLMEAGVLTPVREADDCDLCHRRPSESSVSLGGRLVGLCGTCRERGEEAS